MRNHRNGFTLIELMIVVAIIGILAAIAIPNFLHFQIKQQMNVEFQEVATALELSDAGDPVPSLCTGTWRNEKGNRFDCYLKSFEDGGHVVTIRFYYQDDPDPSHALTWAINENGEVDLPTYESLRHPHRQTSS